ncbi:MAG: type II secretion system F family protein [Rhodospirillales bacterium]|nr:type II secretion system F family protein [Rhodospirillales bacterium]MDE2197823.1 type II secretion system F family protein [Rhodospirillales bacterium]
MHNLLLLLSIAFLGLAGLGGSAFMVVAGQARQERIKQRFASATAVNGRPRRAEMPRLRRVDVDQQGNSWPDRLAGLFGFNPKQQANYPVKWYFVLAVLLLIARLLSGVLVALLGPILWVSLPPIWVFSSRTVFNMMVIRRRAKLLSQFPDCLAMITRSVRAGVPLTEALRVVARESAEPSAGEFSRVIGDLAIGVPIADSLRAMADRNDIAEFRFFATALALQNQTGGRLGETLDNLGQIVRKRLALKARGHALASEAKTTAMILGALPLLTTGGLYFINPTYLDMLFYDPSGQIILMVAIGMLGTGGFVMKNIIDKSLQ